VGWYVLVTLGVISLTSWVSSYPRYLYAMTPFLFYFLVLGAEAWHRRLSDNPDRFCSFVTALWGFAGLYWSYATPLCSRAATGEGLYILSAGIACVFVYALLVFLGVRGLFQRGPATRFFAPRFAMAILLIFAVHSLVLASARFQKTMNNETLRSRNLEDVVFAGQWLNQNSAADAVVVSSMPNLMAFLSGRRSAAPVYSDAGTLIADSKVYGVKVGRLLDVPQFRAVDEQRLAAALGEWGQIHVAGEAVVYQPADRGSSVR
jgi:hypothetical protein